MANKEATTDEHTEEKKHKKNATVFHLKRME